MAALRRRLAQRVVGRLLFSTDEVRVGVDQAREQRNITPQIVVHLQPWAAWLDGNDDAALDAHYAVLEHGAALHV